MFWKNVKRFWKHRLAKKGKSTPDSFLAQNERLVETKRKNNDSTPEILHTVALILPRNVSGVDLCFAGLRSKGVVWDLSPANH